MPPPALRGAAVPNSGLPSTTFDLTIDAAVVADDLLFLPITSAVHTSGDANPTCTDNDSGGNTWQPVYNSTDKKAWMFWKRATSATASKTITIAGCIGSCCGVLKAFSGGDTGATPYADVVSESNAAANETHAGFTPSQADSMVFAVIHNYQDNPTVTNLSFATLGATTATTGSSTAGAVDSALAFGHVAQAGGPTGTGNLTWTQADFATYSYVLTVKPAGAGAGAFPFWRDPMAHLLVRRQPKIERRWKQRNGVLVADYRQAA